MTDTHAPVRRSRRSAPKTDSKATTRRGRRQSDSTTVFTAEERLRMIETAAYFRSERRGFVPGQEAEDWLSAEAEIDALISRSQSGDATNPSGNSVSS
jgi:hypothetical protein